MEKMTFLWILLIIIIGILVYDRIYKRDKVGEISIHIEDVLLSPDQLEEHGMKIAESHSISPRQRSTNCLTGRLKANYKEVFSIYKNLKEDTEKGVPLSPASEWLLDNFYVIENQVKNIYQSVSKEKCGRLSILKEGPKKGIPRVYALAIELVAHTDGRVDEDLLYGFINAYQRKKALSIEELWALPLMINMALIDHIHYVSLKIEESQKQLRIIKEWEGLKEDVLREKIKEHLKTIEYIHPTFAEYLLRIIRKNNIDLETINELLENKLKNWDSSLEKTVDNLYREQANKKISIGNSITSLHRMTNLDWNEIFEELSLVEKELKKDPADVYEKMDFESRNYYRQQVEEIARDCKVLEKVVAKKAIEWAGRARESEEGIKKQHVGFYLLDKGKKNLYESLGKKYQGKIIKPLSFYTFPIIALTLFVSITLALFAYSKYIANNLSLINSIFMSILMAALLIIPISDMVISFQNWLLTRMNKPRFIPKIEFKEGIEGKDSTLIVVPTLLSDKEKVKEIVKQLEVHYFANREENFYFALVGDFIDSEKEEIPEDKEIIKTAIEEIKKLNAQYSGEKFYFFHRRRTFNKVQERWMGWERKRGALVELNELLRGSSESSYFYIEGDLEKLSPIKYIITLDADTKLPLEEGKKLVGAMAHPLNQPVLDKERKVVIEGYGLIQPRISLDIESVNQTPFTRIFAGQGGIDPYTTAISDVYQDLFGEGIFTGKGIYHLETFQECLRDTIPDNAVLSHDLLEGSFIRTGLATDIQLIDGYPGTYSSFIARLHRWVRGDWQLIGWLSKGIKNPLSFLSKWKILDNLRRSLVSPMTLFLLLFAVAFYPGNIIIGIAVLLGVLFFPTMIGFIEYMALKHFTLPKERLRGRMLFGMKASLYQGLLRYAFLPYHSFRMMDAIIRTLYRLNISKKNMLEWTTAAEMEKNLTNDIKSYVKRMKVSFIIAGLFMVFTFIFHPEAFIFSILLCIPWLLSPWVAFRISQREEKIEEELTEENKDTLLRLARKTWAYYEDFAGVEENYLPPDNVQINPSKGVDHRTSPTNIGFLLMAYLTARDLGFISTQEFFTITGKSIHTIKGLETWKGHLFNWYNTKTAQVLQPHYISTVDSGNYISYLLTLKAGVLEYLNKNLIDPSLLSGLKETLILGKVQDFKILREINKKMKEETLGLGDWKDLIESGEGIECSDTYWKNKVLKSLKSYKDEMKHFFPKSILYDSLKLKGLNNKLHKSLEEIENNNSLLDLQRNYKEILEVLESMDENIITSNKINRKEIIEEIQICKRKVEDTIREVNDLAKDIEEMIEATDFSYLYNYKRQLFSIGYNVGEEKLTDSYYDLLASEARTTSYIAILQGKVPKKHWFKLGRALTKVGDYKSLVSWTGTMFEYFMPALLMKKYENTLLDETYKTAVAAQIKYGEERKVPWGTSESGYYAFDISLKYQYKAFGVPELGLKRGLKSDMVISPYSSLLGLPFAPTDAMNNIYELIGTGLEGKYGLYEGVDYTKKRLPKGQTKMIVESFMAHHQGMGIMALNNMLNKEIMIKRFHSHPMIKAGETLLQEKVPLRVVITKEYKDAVVPMDMEERHLQDVELKREIEVLKDKLPHSHLLTNGTFKIMLTNEGSGYSNAHDLQVTRWRGGEQSKNYGNFIFFRNLENNNLWSATYNPLEGKVENYKTIFTEDKAEFICKEEEIESHTEVVVSPEDSVEIRKVTITNHSKEQVELEVTSYLELVLADHSADMAHPAFSNLFVRTEKMEGLDVILSSRRPREEHKETTWSFHSILHNGEDIGNMEFETSRYKFIGRGKGLPEAEGLRMPLNNSLGAVLDPIISLRKRIRIAPETSEIISFVSGITENKSKAQSLGEKYHDLLAIQQTFDLAKTKNQIEIRNLNMNEKEIALYQDMISHILFISPQKLKYENILKENTQGQSKLWAYGISGDIPIVLMSIKNSYEIDLVEEIIKAHAYWKSKGLKVDLVILNEDESSYYQPMEEHIKEKIFNQQAGDLLGKAGGIFIITATIISEEDKILLYAVARIILKGKDGSIKKQLKEEKKRALPLEKKFSPSQENYPSMEIGEKEELFFYNGYGGFLRDGSEYVIELKNEVQTPAPWMNVISNGAFGFQISENGSGFVWAENSRENKITPWSNDPISDPAGEVIYIRDEEDGRYWTPTPLPIREREEYSIRHGMGYSEFSHNTHGISQQLKVFVPVEDPVKLSILTLKNYSNKKRKLNLFYYIKPVMGVTSDRTNPFIITQQDNNGESLLIKNSYQSEFPGRIVFLSSSEKIMSITGDNEEFLGSRGDLKNPEALKRERLSNRTGAGYLPCGVIQIEVSLKPREEKNVQFLLGQGKDINQAQSLIKEYKDVQRGEKALVEIKNYWKDLLGQIQVRTPDVSMDYLLNGWLLYQSISCRLWARSAFYQSGGAYGYRDQLQDTMNILPVFPQATRKQILINSAHQFKEGDVQHWWHPGPGDKGIRTRFSDDLLWLPLTVAEYIEQTQDYSILEEEVSFLEEEPLKEGEDERYGIPKISEEKASVYEHCLRAIDYSLKFGAHGIPLMGSGDWNDGMSTVGNKGKGESVWLGWFIYTILNRFSLLCQYKKDREKAKHYKESAFYILKNIEENAWDGDWYKRAYFDDGTPLGSRENKECMIDSLAQSWSIISKGGEKERTKQAMKSIEEYLVKKEEGLILLFTPPFDEGDLKPGYIKGYLPGVRENGGQYTHASTWVIQALAMMGRGDKAWEYFNLINPINHTRTSKECSIYKVEPYVMAADVYSVSPHVGRGGWTWYTGAAGWMYTVGTKYILGLERQGNKLIVNPCIPKEWKGYQIKYKYFDTHYEINIYNPEGVNRGIKEIEMDGKGIKEQYIPLKDDKKLHKVEILLG